VSPQRVPAASPPRLEFRIPPAGSHLRRARERLRDYLGLYCDQRELVDDVVLCVEEACTNAIRHSGSRDDITIALEFADGDLVALVRDRGRGFATARLEPALPDLMADHGRGLYIIASLMDDLELCCDRGCQVRMTRRVVPRGDVPPIESGLGEVRASNGPGQRETRLRAMLEEIDEAFAAFDWEYRCVHANGTALQLAGEPLDEVLGRHPCELFPTLAGTALERAYRDAMELGKSRTIEHCSSASGEWLEIRIYPTAAGVSCYYRRIDQRKRTERDLERLLEAYERELSRSTLLRDVARAATSSLGLREICQSVLEQIHLHADLRAAAIYAADWTTGTLRALALFGGGDGTADLPELPISADTDCGRLLLEGLPELAAHDESPRARADGIAAAPVTLSLPICHQDETLGALTLRYAAQSARDPESVELYRSVAAILGSAMANARSYQIEVDAREALRRYKLLADEARDAMLFVRRRDGRILEANRAAESMYGHTRDELLGLSIHDLRAAETATRTVAQMTAAASDGILFETTHRRRDGSMFPVEVSSRGTATKDGEVVLLSIVRDISDRLRAEQALRDSEDRYRGLVDLSPEAILVHAEGRIVFVNPAAVALLGAATPDELVGKPVLDTIHPDERAAVVARVEQARLGRITPLAHRRWLRLDGRVVDTEVTGAGVEFDGRPAVQIVARDVGGRVRAEAAAAAELGFTNTLLRAAEALSSSMQIDTVLDRLAELLLEAVGAGRLVVLLWDDSNGELSVALSRGGASFATGTSWPREGAPASPVVRRLVTDPVVRAIDFEGSDMPRAVREAAALIGLRLALTLPIMAGAELLGYVALDERDARREFSQRETRLAKAICDQAAVTLDNARLYQQEHNVAQALRAALLKLPATVAGLSYAYHYRPAVRPAMVGGDFYDLFELDHGLVGIVVGDISGKGIPAAVLTSLVKNTIRAHAIEKGKTPADVISLANTVLVRETAAETFATVFFGMLDRRDGRLVYCNAGHPASVVVHPEGDVAALPATSPLIGAFPDFSFRNAEAHLSCDDLLFLYTDGLTDARDGRRLFGEERLFEALRVSCGATPVEMVTRVIDRVVGFAGDGLRDDLAVLALRRHEPPGPSQQKLRLG
jgi:PAS domain S-box-containing protein